MAPVAGELEARVGTQSHTASSLPPTHQQVPVLALEPSLHLPASLLYLYRLSPGDVALKKIAPAFLSLLIRTE